MPMPRLGEATTTPLASFEFCIGRVPKPEALRKQSSRKEMLRPRLKESEQGAIESVSARPLCAKGENGSTKKIAPLTTHEFYFSLTNAVIYGNLRGIGKQ